MTARFRVQVAPERPKPSLTSYRNTRHVQGGSSHQLWLRHPTSPLPLLPSGPDGIHG